MNFFYILQTLVCKNNFFKNKKITSEKVCKKYKIFFPQKPLFYKNYSDLTNFRFVKLKKYII